MKKLIAFVLSLCICLTSTVMVGAAEDETYISELRIIYADSYDAAKKKLADSDFSDYKLLEANLNSNTDKTGVWLCYKPTTDIEEAITDICAMYMDGGYQEGNYQSMIEESRKEYEKMSETYLKAVDYFALAYEAGAFLADSAYRQLNLYIDPDSGERLGDLFINGIDAPALATIFMEGNVYALKNIRSLLAQGCSYNESSLTYMETVGEMAALYKDDSECFEDFDNYEEFYELAVYISATVVTFGKLIKEYEAVEADLNYDDDVDTDAELKYIEYEAIANLLKSVTYTDGNTLYDFCKSYKQTSESFASLYPLVAALNEGQAALARLGHYYDVVRYSFSEIPESLIDSDIAALEERYADGAFNVYTGVDRSIFNDTYALTTEAYRADAYNESGFQYFISTESEARILEAQIVGLVGGSALLYYAIYRSVKGYTEKRALERATAAAEALKVKTENAVNSLLQINTNTFLYPKLDFTYNNYDELVNGLMGIYLPETNIQGMSFTQKFDALNDYMMENHLNPVNTIETSDYTAYVAMRNDFNNAKLGAGITSADVQAADATKVTVHNYFGSVTAGLYLVGGIATFVSAITLGIKAYNYYFPDYGDVPVSLVNMIDTLDGDRYIKYDAVLEAKSKDGKYIPADTNAYKAQRWIALYYTKSYEAGKPLLCDFTLSKDSYYAKDGSAPVHLFGEDVCYNLNKYNFESASDSIYLSVKQSENNKSAVSDVPPVIGSMIGGGYAFLAIGIGAILGAGATLGFGSVKKKKKNSPEEE